MIHKLDVLDPSKTPVKWLSRVDALAKPRSFEFKPGLNVLWGRNGAGKTSLTKVLARIFHCEQGTHPIVTQESLTELGGGGHEPVDLKKGLAITHDGQGVRHFDPGHAIGLIGGGAGFDWDFGMEGITNTLFKGSAGQTTMFRFERIAQEIVAGDVPEVAWKFARANAIGVWRERVKIAEHFLKGTADEGQPTILLDEPERSYDLNAQVGIWRFLRAYADQVQFIVASHSLFALKIPGAHYVELSPRYLTGSEGVLEILKTWPEEKPQKPSKEAEKAARAAVKKRKESR